MVNIENVEEQFNEVLSQKKEEVKKKTNYDVKNYLNTRLAQNETQKEIRVRIINLAKDSKKVYDILQMHYLPSSMKTYVCSEKTKNLPEGTDRRCPFCAIREQVSLEQKSATPEKFEKLKEIYKQNGVLENYVMRVIERGDEEFGPKFWKFPKSSFDLIWDIYRLNKEADIDIFNYFEGKDIIITVKKETDSRGKTKNKISSIQAAIKQTPVSKDEAKIEKWLNDEKVWNDVYVAKPFEYLSLVIDGKKPFFDKTKNQWVEFVDRAAFNNTQDDDEVEEEDEEFQTNKKTNNKEDDGDDLPF